MTSKISFTRQPLTSEQQEIIASIDHPMLSRKSSEHSARNIGETDFTVHRFDGDTWIFKVVRVAGLDTVGLYTPTTGLLHVIRPELAIILENDAVQDSHALQNALSELRDLIEPFPQTSWGFPELPESMNLDRLRARTLVLNPTEQCNIRCTYCYYSGSYEETRKHQTLSPTPEDLKLAIETFLPGDPKLGGALQAIYFFGGEPILGFKEIQRTITFVNERREQIGEETFPNLLMQVNSNGLLLTRPIMEYLIENDIYLNVSIDGPNHDLYRLDRRGKGTHDKVRAKIEWIAETWPEYFETRVAIICVLSAPLDTSKMYHYFAEWPTAHKALAWDFDLILPGGTESYVDFTEVFSEQSKIWRLFVEAHSLEKEEREESLRHHYAFSHGFLHRAFHRAVNQPVRLAGNSIPNLLGVQLPPGSEYLVLGADGLYYSSYEYQSAEFIVGSAKSGIDFSAGIQQLAEFRSGIESSSCGTCWAAPMCTVAVPEAPFKASDSAADTVRKAKGKVSRCRSERENLRNALAAKLEIAERFGSKKIHDHQEDWTAQTKGGPSLVEFTS